MDTYMHKTMASVASLEKTDNYKSRVYAKQSKANIFEKKRSF